MAIGYRISTLNSNESIMEKLKKIEAYLVNNKIYNIYTTNYTVTSNYFIISNLSNPALNTIAAGDLILAKNGVIYVITEVDTDNDRAYVDLTTAVDLSSAGIVDISVENVNATTCKIVITTDTGSIESNNFTVGDPISAITINMTGSGENKKFYITIITASGTYTSNEAYVSSLINGQKISLFNNDSGYLNKDAVSNPNLIINPDFKINQRGANSYTYSGTTIYTVDRWKIPASTDLSSASLTVGTDGVTVSATQASNLSYDHIWLVRQDIEDYEKFKGKTLTLSCDFDYIGGDFSGSLVFYDGTRFWGTEISEEQEEGQYVYPSPRTVSYTVSDNATCLYVGIVIVPQPSYTSSLKLKDMKLELGSVATQFVPPLISEELLKCQRYYQKFNAPITYTKFGYGDIISTSGGDILLNLTTNLRTSPTLTLSNNDINLYEKITNVFSVVTGAVLRNINNGNAVIRVATGSTGFTNNNIALLQSNANTAYVKLDAEMY